MDVSRRLTRARRRAPVLRVLLEGPGHRGGARAWRLVRLLAVGRGTRWRVPDRHLRVPTLFPRLPRATRRSGACGIPLASRQGGPVVDDPAGRRACDWLG